VNAAMTAAYWSIGRRIVEQEQRGRARAEYGSELVDHLATDLTKRFGRGFLRRNLFQMKAFYLAYPQIVQTASAQSRARAAPGKVQTMSALSRVESQLAERAFPLPWSHYVRLLAVRDEAARSQRLGAGEAHCFGACDPSSDGWILGDAGEAADE
jgi:hypothetical protein